MKPQNVKFTKLGESFKFDTKPATTPKYEKRGYAKETSPKNEENSVKKTAIEKLYDRYARRLRAFIFAVCNCASKPKVFITLSIPREKFPYESAKEEQKYYKKFFRLIKRNYPNSWFFYKIEWGHKFHMHLHLLGDFGISREEYESTEHKKRMLSLWSKANEVRLPHSSYHQIECEKDRHFGYLTTKKKIKENMKCIMQLGNQSNWGKINKKNMTLHPVETMYISKAVFDWFMEYLCQYAEKNSESNYHEKARNLTRGNYSFIDANVIDELLKQATKQHEDTFITITEENCDSLADEIARFRLQGIFEDLMGATNE